MNQEEFRRYIVDLKFQIGSKGDILTPALFKKVEKAIVTAKKLGWDKESINNLKSIFQTHYKTKTMGIKRFENIIEESRRDIKHCQKEIDKINQLKV